VLKVLQTFQFASSRKDNMLCANQPQSLFVASQTRAGPSCRFRLTQMLLGQGHVNSG